MSLSLLSIQQVQLHHATLCCFDNLFDNCLYMAVSGNDFALSESVADCVLLLQMYTYYLRPVLVGHEATLTGGAAEEAAR